MGDGMKYTMVLSENQAKTLSLACEVLARLGMGQIDFALDYVPGDLNWDVRNGIKHQLTEPMGFSSPNMSLGIRQSSLLARRAWDLHAVIRQQIAMNNDFPKYDVWRHDPEALAGEPLAKASIA